MAYYRDLPLPERREPLKQAEENVPEDFTAKLSLNRAEMTLTLTVFCEGKAVYYHGRGYFTENQTDLPGKSHYLAVFGLLDACLKHHTTVLSENFPVLLRMLLPKLQRCGIHIDCDLTLCEKIPIQIYAACQPDGTVLMRLREDVDRSGLAECPGLYSYMLSGNTLYRITARQLEALALYPTGESVLTPEQAEALCTLCTHYPAFCGDESVAQVQRTLRRQTLTRQTAEKQRDFLQFEQKVIRDAVAQRSRGSYQITLEGPLLISAFLTPTSTIDPYSSRTAAFLRDARRLWNYEEIMTTDFVPFRGVHPTYSEMTFNQRQRYFYWRTNFRAGKLLKADLGYLYVAIYELLNNIGADAEKSLSELLRLWESYREAFPYLDLCIPGWCVDFMLTNDLGTDFDTIAERIPFSLKDCDLPMELFINRRLQSGLHTLPAELLAQLANYNITTSRYGADDARRKRLTETMVKVLAAIEEGFQAQGKGFLETCLPHKTTSLRESGYGAILERKKIRRITFTYRPLAQNPPFQKLLNALWRTCENALRQQEHFPGRLQEKSLPDNVRQIVAPLLAELTKEPVQPTAKTSETVSREPLVIDLNRARALEAQSWENTRRLLEALETSGTEELPPEVAAESPTEDAVTTAAESPTEDAVTTAAPDTEASEGKRLLEALPPTARAVLQALLDGRADTIHALCAEKLTFPEAVYEEINQAALEVIGDLLLDVGTGEIYEDYRTLFQAF